MNNQQSLFRKKELVLAVSMAMLGGVMTGCSSDSDSSGPTGYTINAVGGKASDIGGSGAQYISIFSAGGNVEVSSSDRVNTDFTSPINAVEADLGDNPLEVTADTTIDDMATLYTPVADGSGGPATWVGVDALYVGTNDVLYLDGGDGYAGAAGYGGYVNAYSDDTLVDDNSYYRSNGNTGELFQAVGDNNSADLAPADTLYLGQSNGIYVADGDIGTADPRITGISVASRRTLTLGMNSGSDSFISVDNDIENKGTITKTNPGNNSQLNLLAWHYLGSGKINNAGNADRRSGGEVYISAEGVINDGDIDVSGYDDKTDSFNPGSGGNVGFDASYVKNNGKINASGGDAIGSYAGSGGSVNMYGAYTENNGDIDVSGGNDGSDGAEWGHGGSGGYVNLNAQYVSNNTGDIDASAGSGDGVYSGGGVWIWNNETGEVKNAGNINVSGGTADEESAGSGGAFIMNAFNGNALNSGNINAAGGKTTATTGGYQGGYGGEIAIWNEQNNSDYAGASGEVMVSGNLNISGGDGGEFGGSAGNMDIANFTSGDIYMDQHVALLGYKAINAYGGNAIEAGRGGSVEISADNEYDGPTGDLVSGSASNEVAINAYGGNTTSTGSDWGDGGDGGEVMMAAGLDGAEFTGDEPFIDFYGPDIDAQASNSASINLSGGKGSGSGDGGYAGMVGLVGYHGSTNSGAIDANGGDGGEWGGSGGFAFVGTPPWMPPLNGPVNNSGAISANGGDGDFDGADGGEIFMYNMNDIENSGALSVDGGNADNPYALGDSVGGDGGMIVLDVDVNPVNVLNSGNISYSFGTGETNGDEGCAIVGLNIMGNCFLPR